MPLQIESLFRRLGGVIDLTPRELHERVVRQLALAPHAAVTVRTDIGRAAAGYLAERPDRLPGVRPAVGYLRSHPHRALAARLLGSVREMSPDELAERRYGRLREGAGVGVDGLEESYDRSLRGRDGYLHQRVDAVGRPCDDAVRCPVREVRPRQGRKRQLTLDLGLEEAATAAPVARLILSSWFHLHDTTFDAGESTTR